MAFTCVATCNLDQWALDYDGNLERILESVRQAKAAGARYRVGPELEITGYGCEDHFYESDTYANAVTSLARLLQDASIHGIIVDVGAPVMHRGVRFNARLLCLDGKILLVRPKVCLADDGNYRESRWFTAYQGSGAASSSSSLPSYFSMEQWSLPPALAAVTGQATVPFGVAMLESEDGVTVAPETCEELFTPSSPHIPMSLAGCDILANGSGSHHQLRKLHTRVDLMREATAKGGGVYLYANQQGCDGGRLYFDGCAMVLVNGECVGQASQFSLRDVEVVTATVDLEDVRSMRAASVSRGKQAADAEAGARVPRVRVPGYRMLLDPLTAYPTLPRRVVYHTPEEEIGLGPACWLWDFMRRAGAGGFLLPLSGGADSAAVASIVGIMCHQVHEAVQAGDAGVLADLRRVVRDPSFTPASPSDVAQRVLHTVYMGTGNSSKATKHRAEALAGQVGAYHCYVLIDAMVKAVLWVFSSFVSRGRQPRFEMHGGSKGEDLALQNLQARLRMVLAYLMAQLLPWLRGQSGFLLVLGSANVDESLRGYLTKYDCSSADLNPIGAISKTDLKLFLRYAGSKYGYGALLSILDAPPTAELRPLQDSPFTLAADGSFAMAAPTASGASGGSAVGATGAGSSPAAADGSAGSAGGAASAATAPEDGPEAEHSQLDEADMGMSYLELSWFGRLRKLGRAGPLTMYRKLLGCGEKPWAGLPPAAVADKVKRFFWFYGVNRHKMTTLTPSYHAEAYSPDDNRYDHRQFLYPAWARDFAAIDEDVAARQGATGRAAGPAAGGEGGA